MILTINAINMAETLALDSLLLKEIPDDKLDPIQFSMYCQEYDRYFELLTNCTINLT